MDGWMEVKIKVELFCWCILGVYDISLVEKMRWLESVSRLVMEFGGIRLVDAAGNDVCHVLQH